MTEQRIFIGSSTEALGLAEAVHSELNETGWISLWKNAFNPGDITIQRLCDIAQENEFGISYSIQMTKQRFVDTTS